MKGRTTSSHAPSIAHPLPATGIPTSRHDGFAMPHAMRPFLLLMLAFLPGGGSVAGQGQGAFGVSVHVVGRHQPQLAQALPLPAPGRLMLEDANGRHYYFDGHLDDARRYYLEEMQRRGYTLQSEGADVARGHAMQWRRDGEIALIQLRAAAGLAPTRISLRVMKDTRRHAPG